MRNNNISWFGIALIVFGALLLLIKTDVLDFEFSQAIWAGLMLLGLGLVTQGFSRDKRGKVFWGSILFLYSLYFFLHEFEFVEYYHHIFIPATFLILGISFFMLFISNVREWALLIPSFFFMGIGTAFLLSEFGYLYYEDVWDVMWHYWPVLLIMIGLAVLFKRRGQTTNQTVSS